jgi:hypothetical protein
MKLAASTILAFAIGRMRIWLAKFPKTKRHSHHACGLTIVMRAMDTKSWGKDAQKGKKNVDMERG